MADDLITDPKPDEVLAALEEGEPYTTGDVTRMFMDTNRWTIYRRLNQLEERGDLRKVEHAPNRVTWIINNESQ